MIVVVVWAIAAGLPPTGFAAPKPIRVSATLDDTAVPVGAQAVVTLAVDQAVAVDDLTLSPPHAALADIIAAGEPTVSEVDVDGERYRRTRQRYLVFPFASGSLSLVGAGVRFRSVSGGDVQTLSAAPLTLKVTPPPVSASANAVWLPARAVSLDEDWTLPERAMPGQPLTRTVRVRAQGVRAAAIVLPLDASRAAGFAAGIPRYRDATTATGNLAELVLELTVTPTESGVVAAPEISLPWWSVTEARWETARLPARDILIDSGDSGAAAAAPRQPAPAVLPALAPADRAPDLAVVWPVVSGGVLLLGVAFVFWRHRRRPELPRRVDTAVAARDAVLAFARHQVRGAAITTLPALAERAAHAGEPALAGALNALDRQLYGQPGEAPALMVSWPPLRRGLRGLSRHLRTTGG
jgi:hypothetical protein